MYSDHHTLLNLINSYPSLLDAGDHEGVGRLFKRGAIRRVASSVTSSERQHEGSEAVKKMYDDVVIHYDGKPLTRHVITNTVVEIDKDAATAEAWSYFQVVQQAPDLPLQIIVSGRYRDRFAKTNGEWHFSEKCIMPDYIGNAGKHLKTFAAPTTPG